MTMCIVCSNYLSSAESVAERERERQRETESPLGDAATHVGSLILRSVCRMQWTERPRMKRARASVSQKTRLNAVELDNSFPAKTCISLCINIEVKINGGIPAAPMLSSMEPSPVAVSEFQCSLPFLSSHSLTCSFRIIDRPKHLISN